ncbi:hypothetical protein ACH4FX_42540 [Streptomyces sp. NPDC018019]|uniref:hypothetical protein n=1 Tax=Streptomyces sp. NPDC018019 TaxID=3365030 RepID=UPI0037A3BFA3
MVQTPQQDREDVGDGCVRTVQQTRDMARGFLSVAPPHRETETHAVLLVVSELFTNALQHAGNVTGFGLQAGEGTVTVAAVVPYSLGLTPKD